MRRVSFSSTGLARSRFSALPPTMANSVPACTCGMVPSTGASISCAPRASTSGASSRPVIRCNATGIGGDTQPVRGQRLVGLGVLVPARHVKSLLAQTAGYCRTHAAEADDAKFHNSSLCVEHLTHNNQRRAIANNDVQVCGGSAPRRMAEHVLDQEIGLRQGSNANSDRLCSDLCVAVAGSQTPTKVIPTYTCTC